MLCEKISVVISETFPCVFRKGIAAHGIVNYAEKLIERYIEKTIYSSSIFVYVFKIQKRCL